MKKLRTLKDMNLLVDMKYRKDTEAFSKLLQQEEMLRNSLIKLDQYRAEGGHDHNYHQRAIGADIMWHAWVGKKKQEINQRLAHVLAKKELCREQVKASYGKVLVTRELATAHSLQTQKRKAQIQLLNAIGAHANPLLTDKAN